MLMKRTNSRICVIFLEKNSVQNYLKKLILVRPKNNGRAIEISKFPRSMKERLLKMLAPWSKSSFQNFERNLKWEINSLSVLIPLFF